MYNNYIITKEGIIISKYTGKPLYVHTNKKGYQFVRLYIDGVSKTYLVHRVVALTYIPNPENKEQVNHKDGNKQNNKVSNLEWATSQENVAHSVENNLIQRGPERPNSKLSNEQVKELRALRAGGFNYYELGRKYNISYQGAHKICTYQTYTHI